MATAADGGAVGAAAGTGFAVGLAAGTGLAAGGAGLAAPCEAPDEGGAGPGPAGGGNAAAGGPACAPALLGKRASETTQTARISGPILAI